MSHQSTLDTILNAMPNSAKAELIIHLFDPLPRPQKQEIISRLETLALRDLMTDALVTSRQTPSPLTRADTDVGC